MRLSKLTNMTIEQYFNHGNTYDDQKTGKTTRPSSERWDLTWVILTFLANLVEEFGPTKTTTKKQKKGGMEVGVRCATYLWAIDDPWAGPAPMAARGSACQTTNDLWQISLGHYLSE